MAPLDMKFNNSGNDAWISFHGSWWGFPSLLDTMTAKDLAGIAQTRLATS